MSSEVDLFWLSLSIECCKFFLFLFAREDLLTATYTVTDLMYETDVQSVYENYSLSGVSLIL